MAYGKLGLSPIDLGLLTPFDFELKCIGFKAFLKEKENNFAQLAWIVAAPNLDDKKKHGIQDIWYSQYEERTNTTQRIRTKKEMTAIVEHYLAAKAERLKASQEKVKEVN